MSYQVLARKWRPRTFEEMVGQGPVLKALINALDRQRMHHAYLFTGTRGVGKTTLARIIAKCLNCEQGVSSKPCGQCAACRAIDEGRFVDLLEVDAASRTKVEDTRELLENVQYAPTVGRYKVYLIDEAHMLSTHSFNALLKTLEEPPPHVKFLLATTDPQKLPITILSRCLQFALKNLSAERIVEHLDHVLRSEDIPFEPDALWLLGRAADGSMRDALTLTDQAIAFGDGAVRTADVQTMLGCLDQGQLYELLASLFAGDARQLLHAVQQLAEQGVDWGSVLAELLNVLHRVALAQILPGAVDNAQGDQSRILSLAQQVSGEDVQFYYQLALIGRRDLPLAPEPRHGFEMVLLRMLAFRPAGMTGGPSRPLQEAMPVPESVSAHSVSDVVKNAVLGPIDGEISSCSDSEASIETAPAFSTPPEPPAASAVILPFRSNTPLTTGDERGGVSSSEQTPPLPKNATISDPPAPWEEAPASSEQVLAEGSEEEPLEFDENYFMSEHSDTQVDWEGVAFSELSLTQTLAAQLAAQPATGLAAHWIAVLPQLGLSGLTANIAANCTLVSAEEDRWVLHLDPNQSALFNNAQHERLSAALNRYCGRGVVLEILLIQPDQETPAQAAARARLLRQQRAERSIEEDPRVQRLKTQFSAEVRERSIEPLTHTPEENPS